MRSGNTRRTATPREQLFELRRCVAHFALDEGKVQCCTHLKGKASWFLPFNRGWNDGAGNPPIPHWVKTDYLWCEVLTRESLTNIRENYAQVGAKLGHTEHSGDLRRFSESGKKIIIFAVQKFPFILDEIGNAQRGRRFAIIIDEAHSSQGGRASAAMAQALAEA